MLTVESALALFFMLAVSSISLFVAQRIKVPHTVFLVAVGVVLAGLASLPYLGFLDDLTLTPELLFYIFLPILIFESAYNINIKHLTQDAVIISTLSIVSLLVSALLIAFGLDFVLTAVGFEIPFLLSLTFGAIISATDPVAVLALFKEYGAPRRLSLIFEGESIFNDGTGVALFLVVLAIAETGVYDASDILHGALSFAIMVFGGILFGLIFGGAFAKIIGYTRSNEFASITLTMVLAHTTFICAEIFSHHVTIGGQHIILSSIIATATASLLMGNYGRYKIPVHGAEFVEKYWSQFAFLANSLIFIMIGMLAVTLPPTTYTLIIPISLTILIVAISRALSIYPIVGIFNYFSTIEKRIPRAWQHVLSWGSLRGALAVTMVLMIPDTLSFPNWNYLFTPKEFVLAVTVSCVFMTLFVKATTIGALMGKLNLNSFTKIEQINYREMLIYIYDATLRKLDELYTKGYISKHAFDTLAREQHAHIRTVFDELKTYSTDPHMLEKVIRLYAIGIERRSIRKLYATEEVNERVIRRVIAKLEYQIDAIERDVYDVRTHEHGTSLDVFEVLAGYLRRLSPRRIPESQQLADEYLYYRALSIISRKVLKELRRLNECFEEAFEAPHSAVDSIITVYEKFKDGSEKKMQEIRADNIALFDELDAALIRCGLYSVETNILDRLKERAMVTPKVSIALEEHLSKEHRAH
jgi:CPA1 family monovalent cation:H+ antiporter